MNVGRSQQNFLGERGKNRVHLLEGKKKGEGIRFTLSVKEGKGANFTLGREKGGEKKNSRARVSPLRRKEKEEKGRGTCA